MELFVVIMAGGVGSRFWPRSRKSKPKQLLNIFGENSMIRETYRRISGIVSPENVFVITNKLQAKLIAEDLSELPEENIIAEPVGKNTAPCVAVSAKTIFNRSSNSVLVTLPADHIIKKEKEFGELILTAAKFAYDKKALVTFGITPTRPETGYGYINFEKTDSEKIHKVKKFVEKPDRENAEKYLASGDYLWNSGMFIWRSDVILEEVKKYLPDTYSLVSKLESDKEYIKVLDEIYPKFESISIDYGIMEKSDKVYTMEGDIGWSDVGSWESVYELSDKDENGNALVGDVYTLNSKNSYIYSKNKFTAAVGIEDMVIINLEDSLLVCKRSEAQNVKKIVDFLTESKRDELL